MKGRTGWDSIIIGGGPAGLSAGLYLSRVGIKSLLLEGEAPGGQARWIEKVENYPGFPEGISGRALMGRFIRRAKRCGLKILKETVVKVLSAPKSFQVVTPRQRRECEAILFCPGAIFKNLGISQEEKFLGRGV